VFYRRIWNIVGKYSILCCDRRKDEYVKKCFKDLPNPKDGYSIDDCKNWWNCAWLLY
jgi:hypothetical protein